ncbi:hypothetical protein BS50DRAFT_635638 [Corynespora cassiicola Philippines]|uniref:Alpha/beta hydrolase fold-3 domain-containing protein n=1 Tax=Corynespora cassiicola Philippines TaxID=1448308 RepID=A0A2T2NME5_CORCC|nr:hypothetical protein BS50DRAFT_635638 [Corynespora cassiicola Philippines]
MSVSVNSKAELAEISPEWIELTNKFPIPTISGSLEKIRAFKIPNDPNPPVGFTIEDVKVPGYQGFTNTARIYTPENSDGLLPVVIYVHGGGWTIGDLDSEDKVCRTMCKSAGVITVSIDYRKAPENPFPIGLEDVWEGVLWVFENIATLGGSKDDIIIGGLSAGANISAVLAQRARDTRKFQLRGQILRIPLVVHPNAQPEDLDFSSYKENENAPLLPTSSVSMLVNYYDAPPEDIRMSPLLAKDFSGLPPTYIQIAGADPLRDDGFAYAEKLQKAGVPVKTSVYPGMPHGFMAFPLKTAVKSDDDLIDAINWLRKDGKKNTT